MIRNFTCSVYLLFAFFLIHSSLSAQTAYDFAASSGTFTPLTGGTAISSIQSDYGTSPALPIGFTFNYFNTDYTQFKAAANGFITFDLFAFDDDNNTFSDGFHENLIAPLWDDLSGDAGTASYLLEGSPGSRVLTIEWLNWKWRWSASSAGISFQLKLYEGSNNIVFIYRQEPGGISSPSASIGLLNNYVDIYSLSNSTSAPQLDPNGYNLINAKPANGQIYSFTSGISSVTTPTVAASNITASPLGSTSATFSWTNGNGAYRTVLMKQTSSNSDFFITGDGEQYFGSPYFENYSMGSGWYGVYNGTGSSVSVSNLQPGLTYRVQVIEYNGLAGFQKYNQTNVASNFTTVLVAPTGPISFLRPQRVSSSQTSFRLLKGNGIKRVVFMKTTTTGTAAAVDNTTYVASATFGSGSQIGATGWYCVYNGEGDDAPTLTVDGLSPNTEYRIHVVDYNGPEGSEKYFVSSETNNPVQVTTFPSSVEKNYTFTASSGTFTNLSGGTDLNSIEADDVFSDDIPIGFTFKLNGTPFTQLKASSNGFLTFDPYLTWVSSFDNSGNDLSNSELRPVIAPLWDDLDGNGGQVKYATTGTMPNRVFTIEYLNFKWHYFSSSPTISFQVKLYEGSDKIEFVYRPESGTLSGSEGASIGISFPNRDNGAGSPEFYSLNSFGANPTMSGVIETSGISTKPASGQVYTFTPNKLSQTINFGVLPTKTFGDASFTLGATASSGYTVSYTSSNTAVATISGNTVTIVGGGTTTITANQAGDANYAAAAAVPQQLTVNKKGQTITFAAGPITKVTGDSFDPAATSNSGLAVTYSSSNTAVATVSGTTITAVGVGTADITANQAGNDNYLAATGVVRTLTVNKADQTITFNAIPDLPAQPTAYTLTASSSSGLPITYSSSEGSVATINGNQLTFKGLGGTTITASQAGNANYNAATPVQRQLIVIQGVQTMTFDEIPVKRVGDRSFSVQASASSGLALGFASSNTSVATIVGGQVTIVGEGTTEITVSQSGGLYNPVSATRTLTVLPAKITQTITFAELASKKYGDPDFDLTASSDSHLPVSYASSNTSVATVSGKTVKIVGTGFTTITASQEGDDTYQAAFSIAQPFSVEPGIQTITFDVIPTKTVGDTPFEISAVSSSALPVSLTTFTDKISLVGSQVTILKPGSVTIRASQPGDANYLAQSKEQTFCINPAKPTIAVTGINTGTPVLTGGNQVNNQWYRDGVPVSTASIFNVTEPGLYTLVVSVDGCSSVPSDPQSFIVTALEDSGSSITVSPNPSQREIRVDLTGLGKDKPVEIVIYDLVGRTLHSSVGSGVVVIDISSFEKGNYVLKATSDSKVIAKQITKN